MCVYFRRRVYPYFIVPLWFPATSFKYFSLQRYKMDARCRRERARLFSFLAHHINSRFLFNDRQDFLPIRGQKSWMYLLIETQHTDNIYEKPNKGVMIFHHVLDVRLFQYMKKPSQISVNFLVEIAKNVHQWLLNYD